MDLSGLVAIVLIVGIATMLRKSALNRDDKKKLRVGLVKTPFFYAVVGFLCALCAGIGFFLSLRQLYFDGWVEWWIPFGYGVFLIMGLLLIFRVIWNISYDENQFVYCNMFGCKHTYKLKDITKIRRTEHSIYFYVGKKRLYIDTWSIGIAKFFEAVDKARLRNSKMIHLVKKEFDHGKRTAKVQTNSDVRNQRNRLRSKNGNH